LGKKHKLKKLSQLGRGRMFKKKISPKGDRRGRTGLPEGTFHIVSIGLVRNRDRAHDEVKVRVG